MAFTSRVRASWRSQFLDKQAMAAVNKELALAVCAETAKMLLVRVKARGHPVASSTYLSCNARRSSYEARSASQAARALFSQVQEH
eukprot:6178873-Pleurochrysis_carterae.AAC.1